MRIAYFTETFLPKVDGIVVNIQYLLDYMDDAGHDSMLFSPRYRDMPIQYRSTKIHGRPGWVFPLYPELRLAYPWTQVDTELSFFAPDLIHLINPAAMGLVGLRAGRALNIPVVASYHTDIPGFARRWRMGFLYQPLYSYFRNIHNQCDLNFAPSDETIRQLDENGFERLRKWRGGVDIRHFAPHRRSNDWRDRLTGGEPQKPLILFVSRLSKEKRPEMLLDVINALPEARLAIVGDGPSRDDMEALFEGTPTVFTGYLQGDDLAEAYASADVFVFTGANETFGNVVIEAMSSGLPVVVPRAGGMLDFVRHGENGYFYDVDDTSSMVEAVKTLVKDLTLAWRFGLKARATAEESSWKRVLDDLVDDYRDVINGKLGTNTGTDTRPLADLDMDATAITADLPDDDLPIDDLAINDLLDSDLPASAPPTDVPATEAPSADEQILNEFFDDAPAAPIQSDTQPVDETSRDVLLYNQLQDGDLPVELNGEITAPELLETPALPEDEFSNAAEAAIAPQNTDDDAEASDELDAEA